MSKNLYGNKGNNGMNEESHVVDGWREDPSGIPSEVKTEPEDSGIQNGPYYGYGRYDPAQHEVTTPLDEGSFEGTTEVVGRPIDRPTNEDANKAQFRPVVGWMVCISGEQRGTTFELHDGDNFISRPDNGKMAKDCSIPLTDRLVGREKTADIFYDKENHLFIASRISGAKTVCRLNGKKPIINNEVELTRYDKVTIGNTVLMLVPLCGEEFDWDM